MTLALADTAGCRKNHKLEAKRYYPIVQNPSDACVAPEHRRVIEPAQPVLRIGCVNCGTASAPPPNGPIRPRRLVVKVLVSTSPVKPPARWRFRLAMLLAFGAGWWIRGRFVAPEPAPPRVIAAEPAANSDLDILRRQVAEQRELLRGTALQAAPRRTRCWRWSPRDSTGRLESTGTRTGRRLLVRDG